ncbi:hypothetical protein HL667_26270 [Bradyrhizobium sp. 83012]|uniref:site-specific DNA-methyltransferase (cytosine-N(4)-specific) n=1 Tax=Bradyrhizobium aeschynomenes TaxID=2734909 RepID=A0ABX2CML4_9BRAD|nr:hypothetical protein [Bradyrhizobium aeschynomenes]NPU68532.1 hypothetical protein [Bradyrhizobium aeschynomenes]
MPPNPSQTLFQTLGRHPVHPFPARMAPEIVCSILESAETKPLRVLDPMMGSGTVVALAQAKNHCAYGIDIDPLATLITRVWTTPLDADSVSSKGIEVLRKAKQIAADTPARDAFPVAADDETKGFIRYWFDCRSRRQLFGLSVTIARVRDKTIRDALWCAFSRLIIAKRGASRALDLVHSRPHRHFEQAPVLPFDRFLAVLDLVLANAASDRQDTPKAHVKLGDARQTEIRAGSIDLILTSPPYLNAIDYMRCSKFSLVWMGSSVGELRKLRALSVGSEVGSSLKEDPVTNSFFAKLNLEDLPSRQQGLVATYIRDMHRSLSEASRVLVPGGRAIYVVGENTVRGVYIQNAKIVQLLAAEVGLIAERTSQRPLPPNRRYLPPPSAGRRNLDGRMRSEIIVELRKPTDNSERRSLA